MYGFLADLIVGIHVAYVAFVVLGQVWIWLGWAMGWRAVRNVWFRVLHLAAIAFVAYEAIVDMSCPLTVWEGRFRELAGQPPNGETFVGRLMNALIFIHFEEKWPYTVIHLGFAVLVLGTFVLCPPRRKKGMPESVPQPQHPPVDDQPRPLPS